MIVLWILLAILVLVAALLFVKVHFLFDYHERATVTIRVLFLRFDGKELFDRFTKKKEEPPEKVTEPQRIEKKEKKKKSGDFLGFVEFLIHVGDVLRQALLEHLDKSSFYLKELKLFIGTEDAAKTAILCGSAIQAANTLCALLQHFSKIRYQQNNLCISPDFTSEKTQFSFHLVMSCRVIHLIGVLIRSYIRFFEGKDTNHERNSIKTGH